MCIRDRRTVQRVYLRNWNRYSAFNKISEKSPYELRHTFFSVGKDIPEELIKPIGGHSKSFDGFATYKMCIRDRSCTCDPIAG